MGSLSNISNRTNPSRPAIRTPHEQGSFLKDKENLGTKLLGRGRVVSVDENGIV